MHAFRFEFTMQLTNFFPHHLQSEVEATLQRINGHKVGAQHLS